MVSVGYDCERIRLPSLASSQSNKEIILLTPLISSVTLLLSNSCL